MGLYCYGCVKEAGSIGVSIAAPNSKSRRGRVVDTALSVQQRCFPARVAAEGFAACHNRPTSQELQLSLSPCLVLFRPGLFDAESLDPTRPKRSGQSEKDLCFLLQ